MDDILDDIVRVAQRCERAAQLFETDPLDNMIRQLGSEADQLSSAWSGSWLGRHSCVYHADFRPPGPHDYFDVHSGTASGKWYECAYEAVEDEIMRRAGIDSLDPIIEASKAAIEAFNQSRNELLPTLDALIEQYESGPLKELRDKLSMLKPFFHRDEFIKPQMPKTYITNDYSALAQTLQRVQVPHHIGFRAWLAERRSTGTVAAETAKLARHAELYLRQKLKMRGRTVAKLEGTIFLGHGRSGAWRELADFIDHRLRLQVDEFNREPTAGITTVERLQTMLDKAVFALLVLTAEDEHVDGTLRARQNVIHEAGLFQGRLGFRRAIILLEEGCEEFSNIHGLTHISFPKNRIRAAFEDIRQVLEREGIIPPD